MGWSSCGGVDTLAYIVIMVVTMLALEGFAWGMYLAPVLVAQVRLRGEVLIHLSIQGVELGLF